ncbi:MAG: rod shape-determining protein MreC [Patescibacteria group bacterium]|nr:rod shape-determining protein MreC [Patescibacteria group bacterium]
MWLNQKNSKILFSILIIVFISLFILLQGPIRSFFNSVSQPIQQYFWSKGSENAGFWSGFFNAKELRMENKSLKSENQLFLSRIIQIDELKEENRKLREALNLGLAEDFKLLEANILSRDILEDFIIINKGTLNGIEKKMVVINYEKVLIGEVDEVYKNSSRIRLLTNNEMKFSVQIADTNIQALADGQGNQKIILDLISKDEEILRGSLVTTSGLDFNFPSGLLVGKTGGIEKTDLISVQKVEIEPLFDIETSNLIFVITN